MKLTEVDSKYGFFAYGGMGLPVSEYDGLKGDVAPIFAAYRELVSPAETELKHSRFKRIPYAQRRDLAMQIAQALWTRGAFISGFYIPSQSLVLEQARESLMDNDGKALPDDTSDLYRQAVEDLRWMFYATRDKSPLIAYLLSKAVPAWAQMLAF